MMIVKKQNKELNILEEQKDSYLALGYSVIDKDGNILEAGNATEYSELKELNDTLKSANAELKAEISKYKKEIEKLKKTIKEKEDKQ